MQDFSRRLGARIKEVRKARGLTQEQLAEKAGISTRYLSRLEVGMQSPSLETLAAVADGVGVELWELFQFRHAAPVKELQDELRKLVRELDEKQLRLAVRVLRALVR